MNTLEIFNSIAKDYDKMNDIISLFTHGLFRKALVKLLPPCPKDIIDLCCGTGEMTNLLKQKYTNANVIGVDFSEKMLDIARRKYPKIKFIKCDVSSLPFKDNSFDVCMIAFGLRNVENLQTVIKECHRILKPNGVLTNIDLGKPNKFFNIFLKPYMYGFVSLAGKIFHKDEKPYVYLAKSNETFPAPSELKNIFIKNGFDFIKRKDFLFGQISAQICKKNPIHL